MNRKDLINQYANDLYDSIDFMEYVIHKIDYNKRDRKILFDLARDRRIKDTEYLQVAEEVAEEFRLEVIEGY
tara:strand:- start:339 stop:554 length:216 start_codon:yes stop_codon:yes gene_type:complete